MHQTVPVDEPLLIGHRGAAGLAPENTVTAFRTGIETWGADMIELDVHASSDGHCVVIHDGTVDRTTDGSGRVAAMPLAALREFDAGHRFTTDGGATHPFRGRRIAIPTLDEVLEALPSARLIVEVKTGAAQEPLFEAIRRFSAEDRVVIAGMYRRDRSLFATYQGLVSASTEDVRRFYLWHRLRLGRWFPPAADMVQVPESWGERRVVTPRFVRDLRASGVPVHVWTVNDSSDMGRLLDWGVAGLITDRPDILARVLHERVGRPLPTGHADGGEG